MLLIKNAKVYAPEYVGKKDLLVCGGKIECIEDKIEDFPIACEVIDAEEKILTPGFIDQHVHVTGGGGEGSFHTRSVENLYAKVQALCEEGVSAYMLTGAYGYPSPTITGEVDRDIMFVEKVLGVKLAISDHRAPNVTESELIQLASKTRTAGMLSGKPGIVVLHMGDANAGLSPVFEALEKSMIPIKIFRPTHVNRRKGLLEEGYQLLEKGGYIDLTCGISEDFCPGGCILEAKEKGIPTEHITISSDGHGSWSKYREDGSLLEIGVSSVDALREELLYMVHELDMKLEDALPYMTSHVAEALGLQGKKGTIQKGADADLLLWDNDLKLDSYIAGGKIFMQKEKIICKGTYEK